jgi:hypothetical protein
MGVFSSQGNGRHALLGCGIAFFVVCLPLMCVGGCLYHTWKNFPDRATKEAIEIRYAGHLSDLDSILQEGATSGIKLASKLEDLNHPGDLVFMALEIDGPEPSPGEDPPRIVIVDRRKSEGGSSHSMFFGAGYGQFGGVDVLMLERDISNIDGVEHLLICWEDPGPPPSGNALP